MGECRTAVHAQRLRQIQQKVDTVIDDELSSGEDEPHNSIQDLQLLREQILRSPILEQARRDAYLKRIDSTLLTLHQGRIMEETARKNSRGPCL